MLLGNILGIWGREYHSHFEAFCRALHVELFEAFKAYYYNHIQFKGTYYKVVMYESIIKSFIVWDNCQYIEDKVDEEYKDE